jgi:hypothetical protein
MKRLLNCFSIISLSILALCPLLSLAAGPDVHKDKLVGHWTFEKGEELKDLIDGCVLTGYNIKRFDLPLLIEEFYRAGSPLSLDSVDILDLKEIYSDKEPRTLVGAHKHYVTWYGKEKSDVNNNSKKEFKIKSDVNNNSEGNGTMTYADGTKYIGEFLLGSEHGQGSIEYPDGDRYVGQFKDAYEHGKGKMVYANGDRIEGDF